MKSKTRGLGLNVFQSCHSSNNFMLNGHVERCFIDFLAKDNRARRIESNGVEKQNFFQVVY